MRIGVTIFSSDGEIYYSFVNDPIDPENLEIIYAWIEMLYNTYNNLDENEEETYITLEEYESLEKNYNKIECPICFSSTYDNINLNCGHSYCNNCGYKWFKTENKKTCPTCRKKIF